MNKEFENWLETQGYVREKSTYGAWMFNGKIVTGKELYDKLKDWKKITEN